MTTPSAAAGPDADIVIKLAINNANRKFKLPLRDVAASVFPLKIRSILKLSEEQKLHLERFSDTTASYYTLDTAVPSTYKSLYRAAKAKHKLRLRATVQEPSASASVEATAAAAAPATTQTPEQVEPNITEPTEPAAEPSKPAAAEPTAPARASLENGLRQPPRSRCTRPQPRTNFVEYLEHLAQDREMGRRMHEPPPPVSTGIWQVWCNNCNTSMPNVHFHCSICEMGDYDLCEDCVNAGVLCPGEGHWLIKRFLRNGQPVNSSTERIAPKSRVPPSTSSFFSSSASGMPGSFTSETKAATPASAEPKRTCNRCVRVLPEKLLVTCVDCDDYDLCIPCAMSQKHGHHPAHTFAAIAPDVNLAGAAAAVCLPGRNHRHAAVCDGCDKTIRGVRHKCLDCPDWDFCADCYKSVDTTHEGHRFVAAYEPIAMSTGSKPRHHGVYCDGPLCKNVPRQCYISGTRYKCAICDDTDFCAGCEAHPSNIHNQSHPMIKFKTPVDNVSITTISENRSGAALPPMGDSRPLQRAPASTLVPDFKPEGPPAPPAVPVPIRSSSRHAVDEAFEHLATAKPAVRPSPESSLRASLDGHFQKDTIEDGTEFAPNARFTQTWTITNPGPASWPAGCHVRFVGGDFMFDADQHRPLSIETLSAAQESAPTPEVVAPGQSHDFAVNLRAPLRPGKHISYWRIKGADGVLFGHKLWVDIHVKQVETTVSGTAALPYRAADTETKQQMLRSLAHRHVRAVAQHQQQQQEHSKAQPHDQSSQTVDHLTNRRRASPELAAAQLAMKNQLQRKQEEQAVASASEPELPQTSETVENDEMKTSAMVFPKLDKESPASSTYEDAPPAPPSTAATEEHAMYSTAPTVTDVETATERDLDSVDFDSDDDEGFLTDEEYDILDASDEEIPRSGA